MNEKRRLGIEIQLQGEMSSVISDAVDRNHFVGNVIDKVIEDIEDTADWSELEEDEIHGGDVTIALSRVLLMMSDKIVEEE